MRLLLNINNLWYTRTFCTSLEKRLERTNDKSLTQLKPVHSKIIIKKLPLQTKVDASTIAVLEKVSLVDCVNKRGIETLEGAIELANQILQVDTTLIQPLTTVLEDKPLQIGQDRVTEGNCKRKILKNAAITEEDYFVAPTGNIPLETRENRLFEEKSK